MLASYFYNTLITERDPVFVVDVGCSYSGIGSEWNIFGSALRGIGFDPLEAEIARLNATETRPNLAYEAAFVGLTSEQQRNRLANVHPDARSQFNPNPFSRSSAFRASELKRFDHVKEFFNSGSSTEYSERRISIDEWSAKSGERPKILKVDVDGPDLEVIMGADHTIDTSILALHVESFFQASRSPYANSLSAIDAFLHDRGFSIFVLEPFRYSRAALPGPFLYDMFAQTTTGQMVWADVLFLRDMAANNYESTYNFEATPERIIAMSCIMERFGLQDCAAELLLHFADRLHGGSGVEEALNKLVPHYLGPNLSYADYIATFEKSPERLFSSSQGRVLAAPIVAKATIAMNLAQGRADPSWGAIIEKTSAGHVKLQTPSQSWAYAYIAPVAEHDGKGLVELEIRVEKGRLGVAVLGRSLFELESEVWLDEHTFLQTIILPVSDLRASLGVVFRNGNTDGSITYASVLSGKILRG